MRTFENVMGDIKSEMVYQDNKYTGNEEKPLEVWLLIAKQYMDESIERYAHSTQQMAKEKLLKSVVCGVRALMR